MQVTSEGGAIAVLVILTLVALGIFMGLVKLIIWAYYEIWPPKDKSIDEMTRDEKIDRIKYLLDVLIGAVFMLAGIFFGINVIGIEILAIHDIYGMLLCGLIGALPGFALILCGVWPLITNRKQTPNKENPLQEDNWWDRL